MNNKEPIIIVGMHRSGTSLLASWINAIGVNMGDRLMDKGIGNPKGHFEDLDFYDLHESIFKRHKIDYGALKNNLEFKLNQEDKDEIKKLINSKNKRNIQWGWKDPRTCLFLNYYSELLPKARYLIIYRDSNSVIKSLIHREIQHFDIYFPNSGRVNFLKYKLRRKNYHKKIIKRSTPDYESAWLFYNQKIKELIENIDESKYLLFDVNSLILNEDKIYSQLISWNYRLKKISFLNLFDSKLFNSKKKENNKYEKKASVIKMENYFRSLLSGKNQI